MKRTVNFLRLFFFVIMSLSFINQAHGDVVNFPDPNLAIREALDKPTGSINDEDLAGLTNLNGNKQGISDFTSIEFWAKP